MPATIKYRALRKRESQVRTNRELFSFSLKHYYMTRNYDRLIIIFGQKLPSETTSLFGDLMETSAIGELNECIDEWHLLVPTMH